MTIISITSKDLINVSHAITHGLASFAVGKLAGRIWESMKPYSDPRLIVATTLMQTITTGVIDRKEDWDSIVKQTIFEVGALMLSNSLVLSVFHYSGTKLTVKGAVLMTIISTVSGLGVMALAMHASSEN